MKFGLIYGQMIKEQSLYQYYEIYVIKVPSFSILRPFEISLCYALRKENRMMLITFLIGNGYIYSIYFHDSKKVQHQILQMQGNNIVQHPQQAPPIDFQIDLRGYSLCTYLKEKTNDMRTRFRTRRGQANQPRYMTYRAEFNPKKDLEVFAAKGHEPLFTETAANAGKYFLTARQVPNVTNIVLSISIDDLYPMFRGYRKINGPTNLAKQCYHAILNGEKYTIIDLVYPQSVGKESRLTDWMGILISEQIRFDTLKVFGEAYGIADDFGVDNLFRKLFELFKVSVYNDWSSAWETKKVTIEQESKEKKNVQVKKELKKGP